MIGLGGARATLSYVSGENLRYILLVFFGGVLGLAAIGFGILGLKSHFKKLPVLGIVIGAIAVVISVANVIGEPSSFP